MKILTMSRILKRVLVVHVAWKRPAMDIGAGANDLAG
jgi:hypothetical protein